MQHSDLAQSGGPRLSDRTLKIERDGDSWNGLIRPKIRLTGRWLERAGFRPGDRVHVTCVAPGIIELRSPGALALDEIKHVASKPEGSI